MYTVEFRAPRLGLVLLDPQDADEAKAAAGEVRQMFKDNAPSSTMVCTHIPSQGAWPQDVAEVIVAMARADNPLLICNGILFTPGGSMALQLSRMIRDAENPTRFASPEPSLLIQFYRKHATPEEIELIREFLGATMPPERPDFDW